MTKMVMENGVPVNKKKLPSVNLHGVTEEFTLEQIKSGICSQNKVVGDLVNAGQELSAIYIREPPRSKDYYHVTVRVSPDIRSAIKSSGNKLNKPIFFNNGTITQSLTLSTEPVLRDLFTRSQI